MLTIVKFHRRQSPSGAQPGHPVITSTLGKKGLIDIHWKPSEGEAAPADQEFWYVQILRETRLGENRGCFILQPVSKIDVGNLRKLLPGFYREEWAGPEKSTLIIHPTEDGVPWLLPLDLKKAIFKNRGYSAIVVKLGGEYWGFGEPGRAP